MSSQRFTEQDIPDLSGQRVVVTGANSGLGFETARALAARHAAVVMACRSVERGGAARERILAAHPAAELEVACLDLASLASVRAFSRDFCARHRRLDVLINNAGVMAMPRARTEDGFELQLGTNHFGHFALTGLLLERLLAAPMPRVVTTSSPMHRTGRLDFSDLDGERRYRKWSAYSASKLANLLFAFELDRRARAAGQPLVSVAAHPGYADTNLQLAGPALTGAVLGGWLMRLSNTLLAQSAQSGALPQIYAATSPQVRGGEYYGPRGPFRLWGAPVRVPPSHRAESEADAARLWDLSVVRTGVSYAALQSST